MNETEVTENTENEISQPQTNWKNGFWVSKIEGIQWVHEVKGNMTVLRNLAQMDFPDLPDNENMTGSWNFGDFGVANDELQVNILYHLKMYININYLNR